ncbi:amino acid ABC transporter ATP-binding protein [Bifidobacterium avesanii]|uniref:ATP-binding cassette domain-containing protein n=1 Tax=Bifidobacterium avesanii TaxID=1798157 RepID=A0A7K3TI22_9BIFI|nr:amino acid ABC transporter ATP-binding protein [Bifidobacterium avesanii]KAB8290978.1 arginine ABC transporter ATP-binding protein [Bifidobacterium avesanii]NEG78745.1 ATP-binding cassette domain-containing protein [Bifidobacterium avesanii]
MVLRISNLHKRFDDNEVLRGVDLTVGDGQVVGLIGSSGAGKSTLLRCVNFLEKPDEGRFSIDDFTVDAATASKKDIAALRRLTAMVFQSFNLYKLKTVAENVELALTDVQGVPKREARETALDFLNRVGLYDKRNSFPDKLSGGQQQRVALARAAVLRPKVMLLDEPTSALDPENVGEVLDVIRALADEGQSMIIASHEMNFLYQVADHVAFMDQGKIVEEGSAEDVFRHPEHDRTKQFLSRVRL